MAQADTKNNILDTAERLFATGGITATSLRAITSEAVVNLAAVNYHFGSKEALVQAVFSRRLEDVNRERLELLDRCEAEAGDGPLPLETILRAFLTPVLRMGLDIEAGETLKQLFGRMYSEPSEVIERIIREQFGEVASRFIPAFIRALPEHPHEEVFWKVHFTIGTLAQSCLDAHSLNIISNGLCDTSDVEGTIDRMVAFLAAGMRAEVTSNLRAAEAGAEEKP